MSMNAFMRSRFVTIAIILTLSICPFANIPKVSAFQGNQVATVSAATFKPQVAPDSVAASFGQNLATGTAVGATLPLPTTLLGTTVSIRDALGISRSAGLLFVSPGQINLLIPAGTAPGVATVTVQSGNGQTSTGNVQVAQVAPGIFTANQSGDGVPAGSALRVRNNAQTSEPVTMVADGRFIARPIDLGPDTDRVFLVLFLTGLRNAPNTDGNNQNGSAENVRVLVGGALQTSIFAGAQGTFAGLDQVNVEIPRSLIDPTIPGSRQINVSVKVPGFADSNEVEIALAPFSGAPLAINSIESAPSVLANSQIRINGSGISPIAANNRVSFGEGSGDVRPGEVIAATPTQLTVQVPFGANTGRVTLNSNGNTGTSDRPLPVRTSLSATLRDTDGQPISPTIGSRVCFPSCSASNQVTTVQPGGWFVLPDPPAGTRRIFVIETPVQNGSLTFNRTTVSSQIVSDRDNQLPQQVYLQAVSGPSAVIGGPGFAPSVSRIPAQARETNLSIDNFTFTLPANAQATFPDGSRSGTIILTPVKNSLTPVPLPPGVFSSAVVQISPFGIRLAPGGKLILPNRDNLPPSPQPSLYKYDLPSASFVDTGVKASLSEDGKFFTTPDGSITETSIYFVAVQQQTTTIVGRVLESDGKAVRGAIVTARGRNAVTDGNGGFSLSQVPTGQFATSGISSTSSLQSPTQTQPQTGLIVSSSYLRPSGRTDTVMQTVNNPVVGGVTDLPPFMLPPANANRPPTINVPQFITIYAGEIQDRAIIVTELDGGQTIANVGVSGGDFASINNLGNGAYSLRLTPKVADVGMRNLTIVATDSAGGTTTASISLTVYPLPTANAQALQTLAGTPLPITLTGSDATGLPLTYTIITQPTKGTLSGTPPTVTYTPQAGGSDNFTFKVSNGVVESVPATVTITVVNPVPILSSLLPGSTVTINGTFELRVLGSRFVPGSVITFNGQDKQTTYISATELKATINGSDIAQSGFAQVAVRNPAPGGGTSNAETFIIRNPEPVITSINPTSVFAGGPAFTLTVSGTGFSPDSVVYVNGNPRDTASFGQSELRVAISASDIADTGIINITVINPEPGGGQSNTKELFIEAPQPLITDINPLMTFANGASDVVITISGMNFIPSSIVTFLEFDPGYPVNFISPTQLQWTIPGGEAGVLITNFSLPIFVINSGPNSEGVDEFEQPFVVTALNPILNDIEPDEIEAGSGDFTLDLFGDEFTTRSEVNWNPTQGEGSSTEILDTIRISKTQLMADVPGDLIAEEQEVLVDVHTPEPGGGFSYALFFDVFGEGGGDNFAPTWARMQSQTMSNGQLIVTGGSSRSTTNRTTVVINSLAKIFDPATDRWTRIANMLFPREDHSLTMLENGAQDGLYAGSALVIGGRGLNRGEYSSRTAELYDLSTNTWRRVANPSTSHILHTATRLNDGRILVIGGMDERGRANGLVEIYDPNANKWNTLMSLTTARAGHRAIMLDNGRVAIIGGSNDSGDVSGIEIFDPQTNIWSSGGTLNVGRARHTATRLNDGRILIVGGESAAARLSAEIYDPQTRKSSLTGGLNAPRRSHTATLLGDGSVLITGGLSDDGRLTAGCEIFNPSTGQWAITQALTEPRASHLVATLPEGRIMVIGGVGRKRREAAREFYQAPPQRRSTTQ
jgi:uncharacterized protein (TIGR03437 family)